MAADKDVEAILKDFDRMIFVLDVEIVCKGRVIAMLQSDHNNPPNKAEVERRLDIAMQELADLTTNRQILYNNKHAIAEKQMNKPGPASRN
ncbi:hypothetical protein QL285_087020 [Trifolium repens]|jgi:hypothetical protein|nr:hypothetical protein QL285_087020 [Trifolium repens]